MDPVDYGLDDDRWTVRKKRDAPDGPLARLYAHGILLTAGALVGAGLGYAYPLLMSPDVWPRMEARPRPGYRPLTEAEREAAEAGRRGAVRPLTEGPGRYAFAGLGAVLGVGLAAAVAVKASRKAGA